MAPATPALSDSTACGRPGASAMVTGRVTCGAACSEMPARSAPTTSTAGPPQLGQVQRLAAVRREAHDLGAGQPRDEVGRASRPGRAAARTPRPCRRGPSWGRRGRRCRAPPRRRRRRRPPPHAAACRRCRGRRWRRRTPRAGPRPARAAARTGAGPAAGRRPSRRPACPGCRSCGPRARRPG